MNLKFFVFSLCFFSVVFLTGGQDVQEEIIRSKYENEILNARMKLAQSGKFYLIAQLPEKKILLMLRNVSLKEYSLEGIEIGKRVFFFFPIWASSFKTAKVFTEGAIYPSRVIKRFQIVPPEEKAEGETSEEEPPPIIEPPKPKRIYVPYIFRMKFKGGFSLEIHPSELDEESPGFLSRMLSRLRSKASDLFSIFRGEGAFKVRCFLLPEEQRSFYKIIPDDINMLLIMKPME